MRKLVHAESLEVGDRIWVEFGVLRSHATVCRVGHPLGKVCFVADVNRCEYEAPLQLVWLVCHDEAFLAHHRRHPEVALSEENEALFLAGRASALDNPTLEGQLAVAVLTGDAAAPHALLDLMAEQGRLDGEVLRAWAGIRGFLEELRMLSSKVDLRILLGDHLGATAHAVLGTEPPEDDYAWPSNSSGVFT